MTRLLLVLFISLLLMGCATSSKPADNTEFANLQTLRELEGTYQNLGLRQEKTPPFYLSSIIWPAPSQLDHASILTIEVRVPSEHTVLVRASSEQGVEREDIFIEGRHFELTSGRIRLKQKNGIAGLKSGEPIIGVYYEGVELGLDQKGNGKYHNKSGVIGLVYSFLPLAFSSSEEIKFVKLGN